MNLDTIQPVVLVGGKSRRFGRDKLREQLDGVTLVSRPIEALRAVFGPRVALVGECDAVVAALGDLAIPDPYPGVGPAGGILAALEHASGPVFVLSGDLPSISPDVVRAILDAAAGQPDALACLGYTDRPQPCIALYRRSAAGSIREAMNSGGGLRRAIDDRRCVLVPIDPAEAVNVNRPGDLPRPSPR
ncbi:MAG: molybdenum cofactor guanylyltransferase [Phycisphaerales bacterium]|nr:molybdenum cofactor guanylyltransferase [Phycisphaerales bacterium]